MWTDDGKNIVEQPAGVVERELRRVELALARLSSASLNLPWSRYRLAKLFRLVLQKRGYPGCRPWQVRVDNIGEPCPVDGSTMPVVGIGVGNGGYWHFATLSNAPGGQPTMMRTGRVG